MRGCFGTFRGVAAVSDFLVFENVSKHFGSIRAVDGVSLGVRRGEFFSLLGPSGCGKTTLLRIVAGFEHPDGGRVLLDDRILLRCQRRGLFQNFIRHIALSDIVQHGDVIDVLTALSGQSQLLRDFSDYRMVVYSLLLVVVMIFKPSGLFGTYDFSLSRLLTDSSKGDLFKKKKPESQEPVADELKGAEIAPDTSISADPDIPPEPAETDGKE